MPKIKLSFTDQYGHVREYGYVNGRVRVSSDFPPYRAFEFKFEFKIDTGACWTILFDNDFLCVCGAMGWTSYRNPDIINWIRLNPYFEEEGNGVYCPAGKLGPVFRIRSSHVCFMDFAGNVPRGWMAQPLVRGTFSAQFLDPPKGKGRESHPSLFGVDKLNKLRKFVWAYPRERITLIR
jgi:hypothetical protein